MITDHWLLAGSQFYGLETKMLRKEESPHAEIRGGGKAKKGPNYLNLNVFFPRREVNFLTKKYSQTARCISSLSKKKFISH